VIELPDSIKEKVIAGLHGDDAALGTAFQWYRPRLYAHALRICGNTPLAEDAVQDTFVSAFLHYRSLREADLFYPWLKRILANNCYQLLRKEKSVSLDDKLERNDAFIHQSIECSFENISCRQGLYHALRNLSDELRACLMLRYFCRFNSYHEIAKMLDIPVGTVRSRLSAAREKLTAHFASHEDASDKAIKESAVWSDYYSNQWSRLYDDAVVRNEMFDHLLPSLDIRFTSGKTGRGRKIIEREITDDLVYGSRFLVHEVVSSGNITILEGPNFNNEEYPDRCAPSMAMILFRKNEKVASLQIFDSPRPKIKG
jgi:RNA polymerase sigma factor (sigma-70 family)